MKVYDVDEAKDQLSQLIEDARAGEEVVVARNGDPVVKFVPLPPRRKQQFGSLKGQIVIHDSFYEPLTDEEFKGWGTK